MAAVVAQRSRLGDCEADLIVGYRKSGYVLSVIDRKSRAVALRRLNSKRMDEVRAELEVCFEGLGPVRTVTVDNGTEFNAHEELSKNTGVRVYFTHPYCSRERASIENANGLVRYYQPKRSSFTRVLSSVWATCAARSAPQREASPPSVTRCNRSLNPPMSF